MVADTTALIFTYGTLKRGFPNHGLLEDLICTGDASFLGCYRTREKFPLVCGPYRVPFLLNLPGRGHRVSGELYAASPRALAKMDELEGLTRGHYERLPIQLLSLSDDDNDEGKKIVTAAAYYGHRSYAEAMWKRCEGGGGGGYYESYSPKAASGYVYRKDRPQHLTFLDHIRHFLVEDDDSDSSSPNQIHSSTSLIG